MEQFAKCASTRLFAFSRPHRHNPLNLHIVSHSLCGCYLWTLSGRLKTRRHVRATSAHTSVLRTGPAQQHRAETSSFHVFRALVIVNGYFVPFLLECCLH